MGREEAVPDRCSGFVAVPAVDGRKCLARALGKGAQEVALGQLLPDSDHLSFLLCLPFPGASAAVSLAERESGVLQYRSAL